MLDKEAAAPQLQKWATLHTGSHRVQHIQQQGLELDIPRELFRSSKLGAKEKSMMCLQLAQDKSW